MVRTPYQLGRTVPKWILLGLFLGWSQAQTAEPGGNPQLPHPPRVLILYSNDRLLPANLIVDEAIRETFAESRLGSVEFHSEFLDVERFPGPVHQERTRDYLRDKYRDRSPDLIIAGGGPALDFLWRNRETHFSQIPVVHCAVPPDSIPPTSPKAPLVGVPLVRGAASTLELALQLHPDTRQIVVIGGPLWDQFGPSPELARFTHQVSFRWLTNQTLPELREDLARLPDHTIVLYRSLFSDAAGNSFTPRAALEALAPKSRRPIYGYYDTYLGHGIVGGTMVTFETIGRTAGQIAVRILTGENPHAAARGAEHQATAIFDWNQLQRWHLSESTLPVGSVIRFRPPSLWTEHRGLIWGIIGVSVAQSATIAGLLFNHTRRRRSELALQESQERHHQVLEAAPNAIVMIDSTGRIVLVNAATESVFGYRRSELIGESFERLIPGRGFPVPRINGPNREQVGRHKNGRELPIEVGFNPIQTAEGPFVLASLSDISARKQAEQETQTLRQEIAHVGRVTLMGQLAAALAHEINQPLGAILRNAEAAELFLRNPAPDLEEVRAILGDIRKDDQRAGAVIDRMRALLRRRELELCPLDARELIIDVVTLARPDAAARGVRLEVDLPETLPHVCGDRVHLQQVLLNLIINGMDALSEKPSTERLLIISARGHKADSVELSVRDSGPGIPPAQLEEIFTPFFTTKNQGMGMGLAISRTLVTAHGGRIWAENTPGQGATLKFTLPTAEGPAPT